MTVLAALSLWALALAAELESRCWVVLVHEERGSERLEVRCTDAAELPRQGILFGWIWSRHRPPVRFTGAEPIGWPPAGPSAASLEITLAARPESARSTPRLLSAPVRMWEEVPERLLPSWPLPAGRPVELPALGDSPWRLRLLDGDRGSWWLDLPAGAGSARVRGSPAEELDFEIVGPDGAPAPGAVARVIEPSASFSELETLARFQPDERGKMVIPSLPAGRPAALLVTARGAAPRFLKGTLDALPRRIVLEPGAELAGRFTTGDAVPLPEVRVLLRSWVPGDLVMTYELRATSDETGRWSLAGAPPGEAVLLALKAGFGRLRRKIEVGREPADLGDLVLRAGARLEVRVRDDTEAPVSGARIVTDIGVESATDAGGLAILEELESGSSLQLAAMAPGHLRSERIVEVEPGTGHAELVLERAHTIVGQLVGEDGAPVAGGSVRLQRGRKWGQEETGPDGRFEAVLESWTPAVLTLASAGSLELRVPVPGGEPGQVTDLGALVLPAGLSVTGRVLDGATGLPVAGARIWALREGPDGPLVAWARGDLLETHTDAEGVFRLRGLARRPGLVRVDAGRYARRHLPWSWTGESAGEVDLGEIYLAPGVTLVVEMEPPPETVADLRVDLRNEWLEPDMLSAPVLGGSARVEQVPPGRVTLSVVSGRELLCTREVEVPEGAATHEALCEAERYRVDGVVLSGGRPLGPGRLAWTARAETPAIIMRRAGFGGLSHTRSYSGRRPSVDTAVAPDGTFNSTRLAPGEWQVVWSGEAQGPAGPVEVRLRDEPAQEVTIVVPGGVLHGRVTDGEGTGIASARISVWPGGALAFSDADGGFEIGGLTPGPAFLRARKDDQTSPVVETEVVEGAVSDPIVLALADEDEAKTRVRVRAEDGTPAPDALVFLEDDRGRWRVLTAGQDGSAESSPPVPPAGRHRAAVLYRGRWTLGAWAAVDQPLEVVLDGREPGALRVWTSAEPQGPLRILGPGGWDLSFVLTRAGLRPELRPDHELELAGLPPGTYGLTQGTASLTVSLSADEIHEVELE